MNAHNYIISGDLSYISKSMQTLVIDPRFGAAGDMITAALISLGADTAATGAAIRHVAVPETETVTRNGIPATIIRMNTGHEHRTITDIRNKISAADTSDTVKELANRVISRLESAESAVHQTPHPHFHEIGADDAVADIVGACAALISLHIDRIRILPLATGYGTLSCSHGILPVPAPATAEILRNSSLNILPGTFEGELCTPTGAALLAEFAAAYPAGENAGTITSVGRGAGSRIYSDHPNILTMYLLSSEDSAEEDTVDVLETNVDDCTGEILANAISRMMEEGARDASATPLIMKKGRAGYLIRVICAPEKTRHLAECLARETGSLGIRCIPTVHRFTADRTVSETSVCIGGKTYTASVKHASVNGIAYSHKAEYDDCKRIARDCGYPVREIKQIIETESWK